jgi:hypothetical protein
MARFRRHDCKEEGTFAYWPPRETAWDNARFDPQLIVEI